MYRNWICATIVAGLAVTFALAQNQAGNQGKGEKDQTQGGKIVRVEVNRIILLPYEVQTKKFGKEKEFPVTVEDIKVFQINNLGKKQALAGGLKADQLKNLGKEGHHATIRLKGDRVAEIYLWDDEASFRKFLEDSQKNKDKNPGGAGNR